MKIERGSIVLLHDFTSFRQCNVRGNVRGELFILVNVDKIIDNEVIHIYLYNEKYGLIDRDLHLKYFFEWFNIIT